MRRPLHGPARIVNFARPPSDRAVKLARSTGGVDAAPDKLVVQRERDARLPLEGTDGVRDGLTDDLGTMDR